MNGDQLPVLMNIEPAAITSNTTATLMMTITALTFADSWMPTTSKAVTSTVMSTAGRLKTAVTADPSASVMTDPGAALNAAGNWMPTSCRKLITYPDHPTATVAAPSAYSRMRSQPMIQATNSPRVA